MQNLEDKNEMERVLVFEPMIYGQILRYTFIKIKKKKISTMYTYMRKMLYLEKSDM